MDKARSYSSTKEDFYIDSFIPILLRFINWRFKKAMCTFVNSKSFMEICNEPMVPHTHVTCPLRRNLFWVPVIFLFKYNKTLEKLALQWSLHCHPSFAVSH